MAVNNNTIMARAALNATNDYAQRIPDPTQAGIQATMDALFDPMNGQYYNYFVDYLINRIGMTYVRQQSYKNPLAVFKKNKLNYGSTIQEIAPKWIKGHSYLDDDETLLKLRRPEAKTWYHSQNRRDQYAISVVREELQTAFTDEYGLNNFIAAVMEAPVNADEYDEYNIMKNLIAVYEDTWGFYKYHLDSAPTDEESGKRLLTALQTFGGKLQFPSTLYNAVPGIPVFAKPSELVLITTPEVMANLNVQALAALFHDDRAAVDYRTVIIDEFPIPDAVAMLTTEDWFVCHDTVYQTSSFYNPQTLSSTFFLNHFSILSVSPFVPCLLFTTGEGTTNRTITMTPTGLTVTGDATSVAPGGSVQLTLDLTGSVDGVEPGEDIAVRPDAATYVVTCDNADVNLNSRTRVDPYGVLHVQKTGLNDGDTLTVTATSTYRNPSGEYTEYTGTYSVTISME